MQHVAHRARAEAARTAHQLRSPPIARRDFANIAFRAREGVGAAISDTWTPEDFEPAAEPARPADPWDAK